MKISLELAKGHTDLDDRGRPNKERIDQPKLLDNLLGGSKTTNMFWFSSMPCVFWQVATSEHEYLKSSDNEKNNVFSSLVATKRSARPFCDLHGNSFVHGVRFSVHTTSCGNIA